MFPFDDVIMGTHMRPVSQDVLETIIRRLVELLPHLSGSNELINWGLVMYLYVCVELRRFISTEIFQPFVLHGANELNIFSYSRNTNAFIDISLTWSPFTP